MRTLSGSSPKLFRFACRTPSTSSFVSWTSISSHWGKGLDCNRLQAFGQQLHIQLLTTAGCRSLACWFRGCSSVFCGSRLSRPCPQVDSGPSASFQSYFVKEPFKRAGLLLELLEVHANYSFGLLVRQESQPPQRPHHSPTEYAATERKQQRQQLQPRRTLSSSSN